MKRREVVLGLGVALLLPHRASAQERNSRIIGAAFSSEEGATRALAGYRRGLAEQGLIEGRDFRFEVKLAYFDYARFPRLLQELADQNVTLLIVPSTAAVAAAKAATRTIPVVFTMGSDPAEAGFVESLSKPGGNITGIFTPNIFVDGKRVHLLHDILPTSTKFAFITNPDSPRFSEPQTREVRSAAQSLGLDLIVLNARNPDEFAPAFQAAAREGVSGVVVGSEGIFTVNPTKLAEVAMQYRLPAIYGDDKAAKEGGLISYGADQDDTYRLMGVFAGRILKGERPSSMPVQQATKTKLVINLKTAKDLGIAVPPMLLSRADEVIE